MKADIAGAPDQAIASFGALERILKFDLTPERALPFSQEPRPQTSNAKRFSKRAPHTHGKPAIGSVPFLVALRRADIGVQSGVQ